ncbi:MAG: aminotransferase class IV [Arcobacteraceae bacterium]|nr:aminotransferase class IV [Arcobacteraceae bacterium]MDY0327666.1 aminotransferase class IV [Arcobacteraceae bacterium]
MNDPIVSKEQIYFETIKCKNNTIYNLDYHNHRFNTTRKEIFGNDDFIDLKDFIKVPTKELLKCKVNYAHSIIDIQFDKYKKRDIKKFKLVFDDAIEYKYKSSSRDKINKLFDKKEDCDEVIIVKNNLITDTSIANIAIMYNNIWLTPKTPLLSGTTRQRYLDNGVLQMADISVEMLLVAQKIALLNAMIDFDIIEEIIIHTGDKK